MKCKCIVLLQLLYSVVLDMSFCKPTGNPNDAKSYDILNITCVSLGVDSNSSTAEVDLAKLDSVAMENTSVINVTGEIYVTVNKTYKGDKTVHSTKLKLDSDTFTPPKKELPMGMIIAGPAAALGIVIFLCLSYYCHNAQLNRQAKRLNMALYITPDESTESTNSATAAAAAATAATSRLQKPSTGSISARASRDSDLYSARRKSTLTVPSLSVPGNLHHKRGSSWSALADQEILTMAAPRRHSTFIL